MNITLERKGEGFLLEAKNPNGNTVLMDNKTLDTPQGVSPMELLLMGLAGCSAMDIISILKKKRQVLTAYRASVNADRDISSLPSLFTEISVTVYLEGDITKDAALRAAELSFGKYCSVSKILEKSSRITHRVVLNNEYIS